MRTIRTVTVAAAAAVVITSGMAAAAAAPGTEDGQAAGGTSACPTETAAPTTGAPGTGSATPTSSPSPSRESTAAPTGSPSSSGTAGPTSTRPTPTASATATPSSPSRPTAAPTTSAPGSGIPIPIPRTQSGQTGQTAPVTPEADEAEDTTDAAPTTGAEDTADAAPSGQLSDEETQELIAQVEQALRDLLPDYQLSISPRSGSTEDDDEDAEDAASQPCGSDGGAPAAGLPASGDWLSGASGTGVTDGEFAAWRGSPVEIVATWVDNNEAMVDLGALRGLEGWDGAVDVAVGAIGEGESWEQAATGAYDDRWRESLTNLREQRGDASGPTFIRFAHEMNGNGYDWSVNAGNAEAFMTAWVRYRELQQEIFAEAQLVFCVNRESVDSGIDWRETFPGAAYVDAMGVDYYNQYPHVSTEAEWAESLTDTDSYGAPKGLAEHLAFAESVGLPLGIGEWSGNADEGDSAVFIQGMHDFFAEHAGSGPGQLMYEALFNIDKDGNRWRLFGGTRMPDSAETYRDAF